MAHFKHLDYLEFVNYYRTHDIKKGGKDQWEGSQGGWFGDTNSLEETRNIAINGWDAGLKLITTDDTLEVSGNMYAVNSVVGGSVDIGAVLSGDPMNMVTFVDEVNRNKEPLTVYVDLAYMGGFSSKEAMKYTMNILKKVNKLQAQYDVRLTGVMVLTARGKSTNLFIDIKELDDRFVFNKVAFAFHPSFFRRLWHYYLNATEAIATGGGAYLKERREVVDEVRKFNNKYYHGQEAILLPSLQHHKGKMKNEYIAKIS